ncbi:MAG: CHC2 zinc finger domain-containing protein [Acutalibacteraceae bacterium]
MQELKLRNSIEDVASSYVQLKRRGRNLVGLCPFHNEHTPSFNLSRKRLVLLFWLRCSGKCHYLCPALKIWIMDCKISCRQGRTAAAQVGVGDSMSKLRARILEINRETAKFYHSVLKSPSGKVGLDYFLQRGLKPSTITHFGLGF